MYHQGNKVYLYVLMNFVFLHVMTDGNTMTTNTLMNICIHVYEYMHTYKCTCVVKVSDVYIDVINNIIIFNCTVLVAYSG